MLHGAELAMARRSFPIKLASEFGERALAEVQESFDWERITDEAVTLFRSVLCKNGSLQTFYIKICL